MLTTLVGQLPVDAYYGVGPSVVEPLTEHPGLKPTARVGLVPAVVMSALAVNTAAAEKAVIAGLTVLMPAGLGIWQQDADPEVHSMPDCGIGH